MRFFVELSYQGSNYHGWQIQPHVKSIQAEVNKAISVILDCKINVCGAGRTDTGVHAKEMYAHFDYLGKIDIDKTINKLNGYLPKDITIHKIFRVKDEIHARFDAISRTYKYYIIQQKNSFNDNAYLFYKKLNIHSMNNACSHLLGVQDFTSFSKLHTQTHTNNCNIMYANWEGEQNYLIFTITANRFLRNMVRAIVGTLLQIGEGKTMENSVKEIIKKKNRSFAGISVPPQGLFLTKISYPDNIKYEE